MAIERQRELVNALDYGLRLDRKGDDWQLVPIPEDELAEPDFTDRELERRFRSTEPTADELAGLRGASKAVRER